MVFVSVLFLFLFLKKISFQKKNIKKYKEKAASILRKEHNSVYERVRENKMLKKNENNYEAQNDKIKSLCVKATKSSFLLHFRH